MNKNNTKTIRVLAIVPSTRGFGFAILEGPETLVDWGVKSVNGDKNIRSLAKVEELIEHYQPEAMILQDNSSQGSRCSSRILSLGEQMVAMASKDKIKVKLFSRERVRRFFLLKREGSKQDLAEILAQRFPEELGFRLPPKRRPWMSEDYRMQIFDAVALAIVGSVAGLRRGAHVSR